MRTKGFSIIEMLIYMGLVAAFLSVVGQMMVSLIYTRLDSSASSSVELAGQYLLSRLNYDLHRADVLTGPATLGTTGSTLAFTVGGTGYTYSLNGTRLVLTTGGNTYDLTPFDIQVTDFQVTRRGNAAGIPAVDIAVSYQSTTLVNDNPITRSLNTSIQLR